MKKLVMAAFAGTALLALSACADPDEAEEPADDVDVDEPDVEATIGPEPEATIRSD